MIALLLTVGAILAALPGAKETLMSGLGVELYLNRRDLADAARLAALGMLPQDVNEPLYLFEITKEDLPLPLHTDLRGKYLLTASEMNRVYDSMRFISVRDGAGKSFEEFVDLSNDINTLRRVRAFFESDVTACRTMKQYSEKRLADPVFSGAVGLRKAA